MPKIPIKYVLSFSSQDAKHTVENLVKGKGPWLCSSTDKSGKLQVDLQLEHSSSITHIDLGNSGSMTVSVNVGRSSWPTSQAMVSLLPTVVLMTPQDMRQGKNKNTVRMFKQADLCAETVKEKWDRVRIICSQPLKKTEQFGLSFVNLHTNESFVVPHSTSVAPLSSLNVLEPVKSSPQGLPNFKSNIILEPSDDAEAKKQALVSNMNLVEVKKKNMTESLRSLEHSRMTVGDENSGANPSRLNVTGPVSRAARLVLATKNVENKETAEKAAKSHKISLECEALEFLISLNLTVQQINSMNVKGVREQFELKRGKAMVVEERKIFKEIALDYACQRLERIEQQDAKSSLKSAYEKNKLSVEKENTKKNISDNIWIKDNKRIQNLPIKAQLSNIGNKNSKSIANINNCQKQDLTSKNINQDNKLSGPKQPLVNQKTDTGKFKFKKIAKSNDLDASFDNPWSLNRNERAMIDTKVSTPKQTGKNISKKTPREKNNIENIKESKIGKWINSKECTEKTKPFTFSKLKHLDKFESEIDSIDLDRISDDEIQETSNRMSNGYIKEISTAKSNSQEGGFVKNVSTVKPNNLKRSFGSSSDDSGSSSPWIQRKSSDPIIIGSGHSLGSTPKDKFGLNAVHNKTSEPSPSRKRLADSSPVCSPSSKRKASGKDSPEFDLKECPLCSGFFPVSEIETHASTCLQVLSSDSDLESDITDVTPKKNLIKPKPQAMEECPVCCTLMDVSSIEAHASVCAASAFG